MGEIRVSVDVIEDDEQFFVTVGGQPATAAVGQNRYEVIHEAVGQWMDMLMEDPSQLTCGPEEKNDILSDNRSTQSGWPEDNYELGN